MMPVATVAGLVLLNAGEPPLSDLGFAGRPHVLRRHLRRVDAHDRETSIPITPCYAPDPGDRSHAVDSTEGPDVQQDDMT